MPASNSATELWERRYNAFELHKAGYTERQIATQLDVSPPTAHKDIRKVLEQLAPSEGSVERMRSIQNQRYMTMLTGLWQRVVAGDIKAIEAAQRVMSSMNVINGLNKAPTGLPGSDEDNPLWLTFAELASRLPGGGQVVEGSSRELDDQLDSEIEDMYALEAADKDQVNGTAD